MSEFNIRSESIDVEKIMTQIRARIVAKRGTDYSEEQIRELAQVKLERFLDPKNVRSDLHKHYRHRNDDPDETTTRLDLPPAPTLFDFDADTIYRSSRGLPGRLLYRVRRLLNPLLKFFFNPTPIVHALTVQREINSVMAPVHEELITRFEKVATKLTARAELDALTYEVLNNLVVEMTRLSIDVKNHKMRVESIASRLDFDERRARALEGAVAYRATTTGAGSGSDDAPADGSGGAEKRRRRRRRGRRRSTSAVATSSETKTSAEPDTSGPEAAPTPPDTSGPEAAPAPPDTSGPEAAPAPKDPTEPPPDDGRATTERDPDRTS